jgi:hypothetical protein
VGNVVQPLQSVNCHDSHAHGHERHGPFTRLVGIFGWDLWFGLDLVDLVMVCSRCEAWVHVLTTGGMPVSVDHFVATGVTPVSLRPLITVGNLDAWSCLDIV